MSFIGGPYSCGCGGERTQEEIEEEIKRINRELEETDEPQVIPVREDDVFSPVRKREEVEAA